MTKKRILVVHPRVTAVGGGNAVAAWTLQALRGHCEVSLATLQPIDYEAVNRSWGTTLRDGDFRVHIAPASYRRLLRSLPTAAGLLESSLTMRLAQRLDRRSRYDILFGTQNEADFGRRGITYIHYPSAYLPRPPDDVRWYHHIPGALPAYRLLCRRISHASRDGVRRNLSLANSAFIARRVRYVHGIEARVLVPPVTSDFADTPWEQRECAMVALGRLHGSKRWEMAVEIVDAVRRRGHPLALTLIGHSEDREYHERLTRLAATRPWFRIHVDLSREQLKIAVPRHRYAIHTMEFEHFGIAAAEALQAGCLPFAHNSGGPVEIVGAEPRLLFAGTDDAADKIERVLCDDRLESELRRIMQSRRALFTADGFCAAVRAIVDQFE